MVNKSVSKRISLVKVIRNRYNKTLPKTTLARKAVMRRLVKKKRGGPTSGVVRHAKRLLQLRNKQVKPVPKRGKNKH